MWFTLTANSLGESKLLLDCDAMHCPFMSDDITQFVTDTDVLTYQWRNICGRVSEFISTSNDTLHRKWPQTTTSKCWYNVFCHFNQIFVISAWTLYSYPSNKTACYCARPPSHDQQCWISVHYESFINKSLSTLLWFKGFIQSFIII